jgi:hypothetical protein
MYILFCFLLNCFVGIEVIVWFRSRHGPRTETLHIIKWVRIKSLTCVNVDLINLKLRKKLKIWKPLGQRNLVFNLPLRLPLCLRIFVGKRLGCPQRESRDRHRTRIGAARIEGEESRNRDRSEQPYKPVSEGAEQNFLWSEIECVQIFLSSQFNLW